MVFINKLADHSHHDDLRVDDELVVQKLKLPANATVEGLTVNHISGLSDSLGNLTICLLYTSPSPRDGLLSRMPSSA